MDLSHSKRISTAGLLITLGIIYGDIERTDEPYTMEYGVEGLMNDKVIRVEFRLGFRVQQRVGMMFRKVVMEMISNKELDVVSRFPSLKKHNIAEDFRFVILEKFLSTITNSRYAKGLS